jgi:hypothetical protein
MVGRLAEYFRSHPDQWLDGRELARVAGNYAWRTRVSDLRRVPFSMQIINRQRHCRTPAGESFTISEYRFVPRAQGATSFELMDFQQPAGPR